MPSCAFRWQLLSPPRVAHNCPRLAFPTRRSSDLPTIRVNDGTAQRSKVTEITITYDQAVAVDAGAYTLAGRNGAGAGTTDRKSTRLNSSHPVISYAVFCLKKKTRATSKCRCITHD